MDPTLKNFLIMRGIQSGNIAKMEEDKVDIDTIPLMAEDDLKGYIPVYGDRVSTKAFCCMETNQSSSFKRSTSKVRLLSDVYTSMSCPSKRPKISSEHVARSNPKVGNQNARKPERRIEIGWILYNNCSKEYRQLRSATGGGVRHQKIQGTANMNLIKRIAISLFFPNGSSKVGNVNEFEFKICDARHEELVGDVSVADLYEQLKVKLLRVYLASTPKHILDDDNIDKNNDIEGGAELDTVDSDIFQLAGTPTKSTPEIYFRRQPVMKAAQHDRPEEEKQKTICTICSRTYDGIYCIVCHQNEEFEASLAIDKYLQSTSNDSSSRELPDLGDISQDSLENILSPETVISNEDVRRQRISYFENINVESTNQEPVASTAAITHQTNDLNTVALPMVNENEQDIQTSTYRSYIGICNTDGPIILENEDEEVTENIQRNIDEEGLTDILVLLKSQITEESCCKFNIDRRNVLDGARRAIHRKSFDPKKRIDVKFTDFGQSEGAVDDGGPKRELLRLLMKEIQFSIVFEGPECSKSLSNNALALEKKMYKDAGVIMALSIVHGGPAPKFLSHAIYKAVAYGLESCQIETNDITDQTLKDGVTEIENAETVEELQQVVEAQSSIMAVAGCLRPLTNLNQKHKLVKDLTKFLVLGRAALSLQQLESGLETLGVLKSIRENPIQMVSLFVNGNEQLTADVLQELFIPRLTSIEGSNQRLREEKVIGFWRDLLLDIEDGEDITLGDVLIFATGSDTIPPLGFIPQPTLAFKESGMPLANTCAMTLQLPTMDAYDNFKRNMIFGISNSPGFGRT